MRKCEVKHRLLFVAGLLMGIFGAVGDGNAFNLPDSGQTKCYQAVSPFAETECAGTGQDGAYNINTMNYTEHGDGTVTDNVTGLMWQKCSAGQDAYTCSGDALYYNWYEATGTPSVYNLDTNVCGELNGRNFGGYNNWRLPTKKELATLVKYDIPYPGPTIDAVFANTEPVPYWSYTGSFQNPTSNAWFVGFQTGPVDIGDKSGRSSDVRCVRGEQVNNADLTDNGNGTVTDRNTGLVWQKNEPVAGVMTWGAALSYCNGLELGERTDWRLPNVKELESVTCVDCYGPAVSYNLATTDYYFPDVYSERYWSSTTTANDSGYAWYVGFNYGHVNGSDGEKGSSYYVRCARGGYGFNKPVKTSAPAGEYDSIQEAYDAAVASQTIMAQAMQLDENLLFAGNKTITLIGGYDFDFETNNGYTTIKALTVGGTDQVAISGVIIR